MKLYSVKGCAVCPVMVTVLVNAKTKKAALKKAVIKFQTADSRAAFVDGGSLDESSAYDFDPFLDCIEEVVVKANKKEEA